MDIKKIDFFLNDALNKALISKDRIKQPNSNNIADFVSKYIAEHYHTLQLQQTGVIVQSEQLKTCEHNFADIYDHTGTQIVGKKCLNGCGF